VDLGLTGSGFVGTFFSRSRPRELCGPSMSAGLTSVFPTRADTRHLFSQDAAYFRERRFWRCVGRRREEPAARRRATNGHCSRGLIPWEPHRPRPCESPRSRSPYFIDGLCQRLSTWVAVWRLVTRHVRPTFWSSRASAFVKTLCKFTRQRRSARIDYSSPRRSRCGGLRSLRRPRLWGLSCPGELDSFRGSRSKGRCSSFRFSRIDGHLIPSHASCHQ
jgi:hypothetical protein